jgi:hypothetical protein
MTRKGVLFKRYVSYILRIEDDEKKSTKLAILKPSIAWHENQWRRKIIHDKDIFLCYKGYVIERYIIDTYIYQTGVI